MKIVCDACQAKYSISDDKVQGKVFKIRCKKCSNIIVVRGGAGAAEAAPAPAEKDTRVYDYGYDGGGGGEAPAGDDAVWHLVINQDQVGPLTVAEVQAKFASGEVDGETFTWREGFADWLPLAQVDQFAALVASGSTTAALGGGGGGAAAVGAMFGGGDDLGTVKSDAGDLFAAASAGSSSRHAHDDDGGDLFGSKPAASAASSASAGSKLRGERNENSVLFSLNNLAQLASDKPAHHAPPSSAAATGHATGAAGGEGSGLIDIRSMASAYLGGSGAATSKPASAGIGSIDDLPVFGGGGFSEPAVIVPTARPAGNNKVLYVMIGAVGLLAVAAVIMVVMLLKSKDKPAQVAAATPTETNKATAPDDKGSAAATESDKGSAASETKTETPSEGSAAQVATNEKPAPTETKTETPAKAEPKAETHTTSHHTASHTVARAEPKAEPKAAPAAASGGGSCDEVSCVLNNYDGACCAKFKKKGGGGGGAPAASHNSDLPDALDRSMISAGIAAVKARVSTCGDKSSAKGKVKVHVKVGGDGRVSDVSVETTPDPSLGSCVKAAVQRATFAKTQSGGSFSYPFVF